MYVYATEAGPGQSVVFFQLLSQELELKTTFQILSYRQVSEYWQVNERVN